MSQTTPLINSERHIPLPFNSQWVLRITGKQSIIQNHFRRPEFISVHINLLSECRYM